MENNERSLPIVPYATQPAGACPNWSTGQSTDGCSQLQQFMPLGNSLACAVCGCHRDFHQKREPELLPLLENLERGTLMTIPNRSVTNRRQIRNSRAPRQPIIVKRKMRTKVTRDQENFMEWATDRIGWDSRTHDRPTADHLCAILGITRGYYLQWIRDMNVFRHSEIREAERIAEEERDAEAARSLLMLCATRLESAA